jgi:hypothetical protein
MSAWGAFALNSEYYFGYKGILEAIDRFPLRPQRFSKRLQHFLARPMRTELDLKFATQEIQTLWKETVGQRILVSASEVAPGVPGKELVPS